MIECTSSVKHENRQENLLKPSGLTKSQAIFCSVVVPVYNSSSTLANLISRLETSLTGRSFELILVDDASQDESWQTLCRLKHGPPLRKYLRAIHLPGNQGQHKALWHGFRFCRGRYVVTLDDDLQNLPEEIPKLLGMLQKNDLVYGVDDHGRHGVLRNLATKIARLLIRWTAPELSPYFSSFRAMRIQVLRKALAAKASAPSFVDAFLCRAAKKIGSIKVRVETRSRGQSGYTPWKLFRYGVAILSTAARRPARRQA